MRCVPYPFNDKTNNAGVNKKVLVSVSRRVLPGAPYEFQYTLKQTVGRIWSNVACPRLSESRKDAQVNGIG